MNLYFCAVIALEAVILATLLKPILEKAPPENRVQRWLRVLQVLAILCIGGSMFLFSVVMHL
jgi:integral membrane sensor domain MASE1